MLKSRDEVKESTSGCGEEGAEGCVCRGNTRSFCRVMGGKTGGDWAETVGGDR